MTGTPSKDRAEAHETPAEEFSRLVIEYNEGERQNRAEAWNLIADFACEHADTIIAAMNGTARAKGFAEGMKRAAEIAETFRTYNCPRPCNHRPDEFTIGECIDAGECGCTAGVAIAKAGEA